MVMSWECAVADPGHESCSHCSCPGTAKRCEERKSKGIIEPKMRYDKYGSGYYEKPPPIFKNKWGWKGYAIRLLLFLAAIAIIDWVLG